jgi:ParB/RepB/Spo0J family partition protein
VTSGNFTTVLLEAIHVDREGRQRRELKSIDELAESIREVGLIHPLVITRDGQLVAGERRFNAVRSLGWTSVPVQYTDELDQLTLHLIELEENVKRADLTWQEHTMAVEQYHALRGQREENWTAEKTARALGMAHNTVSQHLSVAKAIAEPSIKSAPKFSTALGLVVRRGERAKTTVAGDLNASLDAIFKPQTEGEPAPARVAARSASIINADFHKWSRAYSGPPFNFLHCDFPYGIDFDKARGQGSVGDTVKYSDTKEVYFELLAELQAAMPRICDPSCHMMFWLSMQFYTETVALLEGMGWHVASYPLIWHRSDNKGLLPDPNRGPRQVYETALFCTRGDRKIVRAVSNLCATATTKEFHISEKPSVMLEHFFRMLVDESTELLDPTCGSGMAVKVAEQMGAHRAIGLERDVTYYQRAKENLGIEV